MADVAARLAGATSADRVDEFCRLWRVAELSLLGSALRDDFTSDSDEDGAVIGVANHSCEMLLLPLATKPETSIEIINVDIDLVTSRLRQA